MYPLSIAIYHIHKQPKNISLIIYVITLKDFNFSTIKAKYMLVYNRVIVISLKYYLIAIPFLYILCIILI
jgi:hypothetical protein